MPENVVSLDRDTWRNDNFEEPIQATPTEKAAPEAPPSPAPPDDKPQATADEPSDPNTPPAETDTPPAVDPPGFMTEDQKKVWSQLPPELQKYVADQFQGAQALVAKHNQELNRLKEAQKKLESLEPEYQTMKQIHDFIGSHPALSEAVVTLLRSAMEAQQAGRLAEWKPSLGSQGKTPTLSFDPGAIPEEELADHLLRPDVARAVLQRIAEPPISAQAVAQQVLAQLTPHLQPILDYHRRITDAEQKQALVRQFVDGLQVEDKAAVLNAILPHLETPEWQDKPMEQRLELAKERALAELNAAKARAAGEEAERKRREAAKRQGLAPSGSQPPKKEPEDDIERFYGGSKAFGLPGLK